MLAAKCLIVALATGAALVAGAGMDSRPRKDSPLLPADRRIDNLGKESNINSIQDVDTYIDAIIQRFQPELSSRFGVISFSPEFDEMRSRVAAAEYRAVSNHSARIPETLIASVFNDVMNTWNAPTWTRISVEELHAYRILLATMRYPASIARSKDGAVADSCRPVEAVLLLYRLEREHGIPSGLRDTLKSEQSNSGPQLLLPPGQSYSHLVAGSSASAEMARTSSQLRTAALEHEREYTTARNNYFSAHPDTGPATYVQRILERLGVD